MDRYHSTRRDMRYPDSFILGTVTHITSSRLFVLRYILFRPIEDMARRVKFTNF